MDEQDSLAIRIRTFLRDLLGSRLTEHMERELLQLRDDYQSRLLDRERVISDLRADLAAATAKLDRYELVLIPLCNPVARSPRQPSTLQPTTESPRSSWQEIQLANDREQARLAMEESRKVKENPNGVQNG